MDLFDEFPEIHLDDLVQAKEHRVDEVDGGVFEVFRSGDLGRVVGKEPGSCPTIQWERTGRVFDCDPSAYHVLAEAGFASTRETTPKEPRRRPIKRNIVGLRGKKKGAA